MINYILILIIWVLIGWVTWIIRAISHYRDDWNLFDFDWGIFTSRALIFTFMGGLALVELIFGWADWNEMERWT